LRDENLLKLQKKPATAELIQWVYLLQEMQFDPQVLDESHKMNEEAKKKLFMSYTVLAKTREDLKTIREHLNKQ
jgi:hypothetical protein